MTRTEIQDVVEVEGSRVLPAYSVVIPVYCNEPTLPAVVERMAGLAGELDDALEVVFVVDGSPDGSLPLLRRLLAETPAFSSQLIALSRNFGAFSAIKAGLAAAQGSFIAVMSADLQEPTSLVRDFFAALSTGDASIAVGRRVRRSDPMSSAMPARIFWGLYRRLVQKEIPPGGTDVFACTRQVASELIRLDESHTSLIGLLYWLGFPRVEIPYERAPREHGTTSWSFRRRLGYLTDSVFSFTQLPVKVITAVGTVGVTVSLAVGIAVFVAWVTGGVEVRGYTPLMLVMVFMASSILLSLGVIGSYVWRAYENTKNRPGAVPMTHERFHSGP